MFGGKIMNNTTSSGISLGSAIAVVLSYSINQSIFWMIIHGIFGWFYVIYHAIKYWGKGIMDVVDFWERDYILKKYYRNLYKIQDLKEDT